MGEKGKGIGRQTDEDKEEEDQGERHHSRQPLWRMQAVNPIALEDAMDSQGGGHELP